MNRAQHEEAERPKVETWASRRWGSFGQLPVSSIKTSCAIGAPPGMKMRFRAASRRRVSLWYKYRWKAIAWRSEFSL